MSARATPTASTIDLARYRVRLARSGPNRGTHLFSHPLNSWPPPIPPRLAEQAVFASTRVARALVMMDELVEAGMTEAEARCAAIYLMDFTAL